MATTSTATAIWEGKLKDGKGTFKAGSGAFGGSYTFATRIETQARCTIDTVDGAPKITTIVLSVRGDVPRLDQAGFQKAAEAAKTGCPVSKALQGNVSLLLEAKLG